MPVDNYLEAIILNEDICDANILKCISTGVSSFYSWQAKTICIRYLR